MSRIYIGLRSRRIEPRDPSLRAFKSHVAMLAAHYFTNGNSASGPRARGSITIVAALSREKMQNYRREHSRGCIKSGVVIYRNSCGQSLARAKESSLVTHLQENFPPRVVARERQTPRESAMIVAITEYILRLPRPRLPF